MLRNLIITRINDGYDMRRFMINSIFPYAETKAQISCAVAAQLTSVFFFAK